MPSGFVDSEGRLMNAWAQPDPADLTERYQLERGDWQIAAVGEARCSSYRCPRPAVMILIRRRQLPAWNGGVREVPVRWGCCEQHSYGRVIIDGRIYFDRERFR